MDAWQLTTVVLLGLCSIASGAALFIATRGSNARLLREFGELTAHVQAIDVRVGGAVNAVAAQTEEFTKQRVFITGVLEDAIDTMETAERKRKAARQERRHAEEARDAKTESQEPDTFTCNGCGYVHQRGENCVDCAKRRFRSMGEAV